MQEYLSRFAREASRLARTAVAISPALLYAACGGGTPTGPNITPTPTPTPVYKVHVSGQVKGTFSRNPIANYDLKIDNAEVPHSADGYSADVETGSRVITVTSPDAMLPRETRATFTADAQFDVYILERGSGFNIAHYRQVALGVESGGRSYRFRHGVNPRVVFVRTGAPEGTEWMAQNAANEIGRITGNILRPSFETVDVAPALSEGMILVKYDTSATGGLTGINTAADYLINSANVIFPLRWNNSSSALLEKHEITGHGIGLDHSPDGIMNPSCGVCDITQDDVQSATLKYSRNPGHELSSADKD